MLKIENAEGIVLAFLHNIDDAKVKEALNGEYTLSFVATIDHLKTDFLYDEENLVNYNDDLFRVISLEELHDEDDALTMSVECEHISYDLINNVMSKFNYTYANAGSVMAQCLLGTDFNLRSCDLTEKTDIQYTEACNSKQISIAIANNWHGELKYYRHYIDLLKNRGQNRGTGFIFGKNLKSVKRIINRAEGTTSYEVDIVEGSETEELGYYELGDIVRIMDYRLNVDYECKIIEIEKDILSGLNSKVVLGDAIKDMRSTFSNVRKDVQEVKQTLEESAPDWDKINGITNKNGDIILGKLNTLTQIASKIVNSTGTFFQEDSASMWMDQPTFEASTFATKWSAQGLVFANSKKNNNTEWEWQTAIGADGVVATSVTTSCLQTLQANILSLVVTNLVGKTITGVTMNGSKFISTSNNNTEMILDAGRITFKSGNKQGFLYSDELSLFGDDNHYVVLQVYNDFSIGEGSMLYSDATLILGNSRYSDNIQIRDDGYIDINPASGQSCRVTGDFEVWGEKPAVIPTQHFGVRTLYCEEADRSYFSSKGMAETVNGEVTIKLDPVFLEVIELNSTFPYLIFLTSYSDTHIWVDSVEDLQFTIKSDKDTKFSYDIKAIRISFGKKYLEEKKNVSKKALINAQKAAIVRMS